MGDDRYIDNCRNTYKEDSYRGKYRDKYRGKYRDNSFDSDRGRSSKKHCLHNSSKDKDLVSNNPQVECLHTVLVKSRLSSGNKIYISPLL